VIGIISIKLKDFEIVFKLRKEQDSVIYLRNIVKGGEKVTGRVFQAENLNWSEKFKGSFLEVNYVFSVCGGALGTDV